MLADAVVSRVDARDRELSLLLSTIRVSFKFGKMILAFHGKHFLAVAENQLARRFPCLTLLRSSISTELNRLSV